MTADWVLVELDELQELAPGPLSRRASSSSKKVVQRSGSTVDQQVVARDPASTSAAVGLGRPARASATAGCATSIFRPGRMPNQTSIAATRTIAPASTIAPVCRATISASEGAGRRFEVAARIDEVDDRDLEDVAALPSRPAAEATSCSISLTCAPPRRAPACRRARRSARRG